MAGGRGKDPHAHTRAPLPEIYFFHFFSFDTMEASRTTGGGISVTVPVFQLAALSQIEKLLRYIEETTRITDPKQQEREALSLRSAAFYLWPSQFPQMQGGAVANYAQFKQEIAFFANYSANAPYGIGEAAISALFDLLDPCLDPCLADDVEARFRRWAANILPQSEAADIVAAMRAAIWHLRGIVNDELHLIRGKGCAADFAPWIKGTRADGGRLHDEQIETLFDFSLPRKHSPGVSKSQKLQWIGSKSQAVYFCQRVLCGGDKFCGAVWDALFETKISAKDRDSRHKTQPPQPLASILDKWEPLLSKS